ncbi:DgyrCDS14169 [Dimorphilus gyrociliatus]|uniref:DgyrCDS14169 n=1 Tax=Dimorphilus gyrociliatus TaxID=2664684 RepID=A0A7I8WCT6_9ANNE|nr:DgyrCDS14169 [Dimorphilus gyrociliatus]
MSNGSEVAISNSLWPSILQTNGNDCPVCKESIEKYKVFPDNFARREICALPICCPYQQYGCSAKITLTTKVKHAKEYQHIEEQCPALFKQCEICCKQVLLADFRNHHKACKKENTTCAYCLKSLKLCELSLHEDNCGEDELTCQFSDIGCPFRVAKKEKMEEHLTDPFSIYQHQFYLKEAFLQKNSSSRASEKRQDDQLAYLNNKVSYLESVVEKQANHLDNNNSGLNEERYCFGRYIWKVYPVDELRQKAVLGIKRSVHSSSFYTSPHGYKMSLRINLNGIDSSLNKCISLFIHIMQGEYDDYLSWPFRGTITLTLVGQNGHDDVVEILKTRTNLAAFFKPNGVRNYKGFGYMELVPLNTLGNYVKDNTLVVRVKIVEE